MQINEQIDNMQIIIDLPSGFWIADSCNSGIGKTYLFKKLHSLVLRGVLSVEPLLLTYNPASSARYICTQIDSYSGNFIVLDRFDRYFCGDIVNSLLTKKDCAILMDLKTEAYVRKVPRRRASLKFNEKELILKAYDYGF